MNLPHFKDKSDQLDFLVKLACLYMEPRGSLRNLGAKSGFTPTAICRAVRVGRMTLGMGYGIEKAVGMPSVIKAEMFTEDLTK